MNDKETTMKPLLLAIVAVLLALNLIATTSPASPDVAPGTANANGPPVPTIVKLLLVTNSVYHRFWSDGRHDQMQRTEDCDYVIEKSLSHGPVEHPFPVVDAVPNHVSQTFMLTYADGRVDIISNVQGATGDRCTVAGIGSPSFCIADVDRNGSVGIEDFLIVLGQWGQPCQ